MAVHETTREPFARFVTETGYDVPGGTFTPNEDGFYDFSGNVWEWVDNLARR